MFTQNNASKYWLYGVTVVAVIALLTACGGGGGGSTSVGVGSGGTGIVTGFGSVIIDGVRYEDSALDVAGAVTNDDNGGATPRTARRTDLRVGQRIELEYQGVAGSDDKIVTARIDSEIQGPVTTALASGATSFAVMGRQVLINTTAANGPVTAMDSPTYAVNALVEVHGTLDASGNIQASRIEAKPAATVYKASGLISAIGSGTISIPGFTVNTSNATVTPANTPLAVGQKVKVFTATNGYTAGNPGILNATAIRIKRFGVNQAESRIRGKASGVNGTTFVVEGITVDASGIPAQIPAAGKYVKVRGSYNANTNTLTATSIKKSDDADETANERIEVKGSVVGLTTANGNKTFTIRNTSVIVASGIVNYDAIVEGAYVEVKGTSYNTSNQLVVTSVSVETESVSASSGSEVEFRGTVSNLNTSTKTFTLSYGNGLTRTVTYSNAEVTGTPANNTPVKVEGRSSGSNSVDAREVKFGTSAN